MTGRLRGFTLIEVIVAISLMGVGALGVMALLRQTARANRHARRMDTATQIAETWLERLKIDAMEWPLPDGDDPLRGQTADHTARVLAVENQLLGSTQWLRLVSGHAGPIGPFQTIPIDANPLTGTGPDISNAFGERGRDVILGAGEAHSFCSSFRLSWVHWPRTLRADIRVWWPREGSGVDPTAAPFSLCQDADMGADALASYHTVYLSSLISATRIQH